MDMYVERVQQHYLVLWLLFCRDPEDVNRARSADGRDQHEESQTQPETQLVPDSQEDVPPSDLKRKPTSVSNEQEEPAVKKIKVSIGPAVDLGD